MAARDSQSLGTPLVGDVIADKYRIESVAGEGGMGIVYEAEHVILRQRVAVKVLVPGGATYADAVERFSFEASVIARIACEHVVRVMDAGMTPGGAPYLVMEYLEGCDLADLLARERPLPPADVVDYALQALEALAHAHALRVIHGDLKPANLFLARNLNGRHVIKLLDFGVSRSLDPGVSDLRIAGSPAYMSPEQLTNGTLDARTDIWSLGVVMYELLSGAAPFGGAFADLAAAIVQRGAAPLRESAPEIAPGLAAAVDRCLEREPEARWASAAELARAIAPYGSGDWTEALERIACVLTTAAPARSERRFETLDTALQALETDAAHLVAETMAPPARAPAVRTSVFGLGDTMPAPPSHGAPAVLPPLAPTPSKPRLRILVSAATDVVARDRLRALAAAGFAGRASASLTEVDALVDTYKPHLLVMELDPEAQEADEVCRRVKARCRATLPVVVLADLPQDVLAERAKDSGADAFLSSAGGVDALIEFVRNVCAMTYSPEHLP